MSLKPTLIILLFVCLSMAWAKRKKLECSFTIFRNTTDQLDATFFDHIETYFQDQSVTHILGNFLENGNVITKLRFFIEPHDQDVELHPDFLELKISSGPEDTDFFISDLSYLDKKAFLAILKNAFQKSYYNHTVNDHSVNTFNNMFDDKIIADYFRYIIPEPPLILFVVLDIRNSETTLIKAELSSPNKSICGLRHTTDKQNEADQSLTALEYEETPENIEPVEYGLVDTAAAYQGNEEPENILPDPDNVYEAEGRRNSDYINQENEQPDAYSDVPEDVQPDDVSVQERTIPAHFAETDYGNTDQEDERPGNYYQPPPVWLRNNPEKKYRGALPR